MTPELSLGPHPCKPFCLSREPKAKVATIPLRIIGCKTRMFQQKMTCKILDGIINEINSLSTTIVKGHPNLVNMHSYRNFAIIVIILVLNAFVSTHLVA